MTEDLIKATANQKVFISLDAYTKLLREYERVCKEYDKARAARRASTGSGPASIETAPLYARKCALEFVFNVTGLPVR